MFDKRTPRPESRNPDRHTRRPADYDRRTVILATADEAVVWRKLIRQEAGEYLEKNLRDIDTAVDVVQDSYGYAPLRESTHARLGEYSLIKDARLWFSKVAFENHVVLDMRLPEHSATSMSRLQEVVLETLERDNAANRRIA